MRCCAHAAINLDMFEMDSVEAIMPMEEENNQGGIIGLITWVNS